MADIEKKRGNLRGLALLIAILLLVLNIGAEVMNFYIQNKYYSQLWQISEVVCDDL